MTAHDLAAVYAIDGLDDTERAQFEVHLATCASCRQEVRELQEAVAATLVEPVAAPLPAGLRDRVLADIARTPQVPRTEGTGPTEADGPITVGAGADRNGGPVASSDRGGPTTVGAGVDRDGGPPATGHLRRPTAVGAEGGRVVSLAERRARRGPGPRVLSLAAAVVLVVAGALATLSLRGGPGTEADSAAAVFAAPDVRTVALQGANGTITVAWSTDRGTVAVRAEGLPPTGAGRRYELWRIDGSGPAPAGLFAPDAEGRVSLVTAPLTGQPAAWGVTLEPEGGSLQPTGPILYQATV